MGVPAGTAALGRSPGPSVWLGGQGLGWFLSVCWSARNILKMELGASLAVQWLRVCLAVQGTRVRSLGREDHTCHRAAKPASHTY